MTDAPGAELRAVLSAYDLGELDTFRRDPRGTVNTSYFVGTVKDGRRQRYFLRRYKPTVGREEIRFEHALIQHLVERGHCPVARVYATRQGMTVHEQGGAYYAVFDYLPGDDRYTWIGPRCTEPELRASGRELAQFHSDVATFVAPGRREEPRILELLDAILRTWEETCGRKESDVLSAYAAKHAQEVRRSLVATSRALQRAAPGLPQVTIHSDYHPGNLKFQGDEVSALVDFDWAKVDFRAFDVALATWYFCASWEGRADGRIRLKDLQAFVGAYQQRLAEPADLPPLSTAELVAMPDLINAGNLYILYWGLREYLAKPVEPKEYLVYVRHSLASARWLERPANRRRLSQALQHAAHPLRPAGNPRSRQ